MSCTSALLRHWRSWRPTVQMIFMPPPPRFCSVTSIARFSLATAASAALSRACHYHPYELAPTAAELARRLNETAGVLPLLQS
jgi:hypothetical protein